MKLNRNLVDYVAEESVPYCEYRRPKEVDTPIKKAVNIYTLGIFV